MSVFRANINAGSLEKCYPVHYSPNSSNDNLYVDCTIGSTQDYLASTRV